MLEIAQLQSDEIKQKEKLEDAVQLMSNIPSLKIELIKWRMKLREDNEHWKEREEGIFDDQSNEDQEGAEGKKLRGLERYYHFIIDKVYIILITIYHIQP